MSERVVCQCCGKERAKVEAFPLCVWCGIAELRAENERLRQAIEAQRVLHASNCEAWRYTLQHHHDEACGYKAERDEARAGVKRLVDELVTCAGEENVDLPRIYQRYPWLKGDAEAAGE